MADRLTQLQDTVNQVYCHPHTLSVDFYTFKIIFQQAEHFCNCIGVLQQCSVPSKFPGFDRTGSPQQNQQEDFAQLFSTLIARTAKDIDTIIESLPNEDSSQELQVQSLRQLEVENQEAAERLEEIVQKGEKLLERIQEAQANIFKAIQLANNLG
jgi:mediator of RNA polymerase II transcription subunit 21